MNKYKTHVPGLDTLFHGGLQIDNSFDDVRQSVESVGQKPVDGPSGHSVESGFVVVVRGEKDVYKTCLSMQLMNGLYSSIHQDRSNTREERALFYSINKTTSFLNDYFLDMIIERVLHDIVKQYRVENFNSKDRCEGINGRRDIQALIDFLFDKDNERCDNRTRGEVRTRNLWISDKLPKMICEGIVVYNHRTNALHY
ncbi:MAG: hypothetical protein K2J58_03440, partial [Muribaculaceae bacterium]|nr:hypothetical protein [Muribaculaceae bacterium]